MIFFLIPLIIVVGVCLCGRITYDICECCCRSSDTSHRCRHKYVAIVKHPKVETVIPCKTGENQKKSSEDDHNKYYQGVPVVSVVSVQSESIPYAMPTSKNESKSADFVPIRSENTFYPTLNIAVDDLKDEE